MKKTKILVVDDDENLAFLIKARLNDKAYDVRIANSAGMAYRTFLRFKPHVIITDIGLGGDNGLDLMRRMRRKRRSMRTIYMTAAPERYRSALAQEKQLYQAEVVAKPFQGNTLIDMVSAQAHGYHRAA
jgi:two-component system, NtrC family, response regulator AtoC